MHCERGRARTRHRRLALHLRGHHTLTRLGLGLRLRLRLHERYGDERGEYVLCRDNKRCIDSRATNSSAARFANDSRGTEKRNNARFRALRVEATRRIRPGDEIFVAYGRDYWK